MMFLRFSKSQVQKLIVNRHIRPNVLCDIETIMNLETTGSLSLLRIITSPLRFNSQSRNLSLTTRIEQSNFQSRNLSLTTRKEDLALNTDPFSNDIDTKVSSA
jgi:ABC-type microcin C transport system permease subunit YejE